MSFSSLFLLLGALISSGIIQQTQPKLLKTTAITLIISVIAPLFSISILTTIAFYFFGVCSVIFLIFSIRNKQWLAIIISFFVVLSVISKLLNLPFTHEFRLLMLIPLLAFLLTFSNRKKHKTVYSLLIVFVAYQIGEFLKIWF